MPGLRNRLRGFIHRVLIRCLREFQGRKSDGKTSMGNTPETHRFSMKQTQTQTKLMSEITSTEAMALGYRPMTTSYKIPNEQWMLDRVIEDMDRGQIKFALVTATGGGEVWRK
jgi:hypothetical protein